MKRLRLALLLVTLALALPVAGLVWRALTGIAVERAVQHQTVADRLFDEMEAELSRFLLREEARPFEDYRFYRSGDERSPLASQAAEPFVVGAFQIDPDGSVHTPLRPRDVKRAERRGDWPPEAWTESAIARVTEAASDFRRSSPDALPKLDEKTLEPKPSLPREFAPAQDPGTTQPIDGPLAKSAKKESLEDFDDEGAGAYEVLQSLNRAADARSERKVQVAKAKVAPAPQRKSGAGASSQVFAESPAPSAAVPPSAPRPSARRNAPGKDMDRADHGFGMADAVVLGAVEPVAEQDLASRDAETPAADDTASESAEAESEAVLEELPLDQLRALGYARTTESSREQRAEAARTRSAGGRAGLEGAEDVQLALEPMVGRAAQNGGLVLYRTVLVGEQGYRQGLVLDRAALGRALAEHALGGRGLASIATLAFDAETQLPSGGYAFQHRFAEPFDALSARLHLRELPGSGGGAGTIYALVGLLIVAGLAGLFAIHHMASVVVRFAERRSNFVAAVTHELKTPLTSIRMYAEMLRDGLVPTDAKRDEYYGTITDESERLSRLIDNVLEFSRLERGAREMNLHVGSIGPLLEESVERLRAHARSQGFELESEIEPDLPPIRFDRDALLQVIYNLVDNAMKYAVKAPSRTIRLEAHAREDGVELAVRDFGPGVSGRHLAHVFEPFYRGEDELTRETKGTGIGLALVKELGEKMGARVRGTNPEGGGFRVGLWFEPAELG